MTAYEELRVSIIDELAILPLEVAGRITNEILSIITERCWLKDERLLPTNPFYNVDTAIKSAQWVAYGKAQQDMKLDGWWPVKEIKKEE